MDEPVIRDMIEKCVPDSLVAKEPTTWVRNIILTLLLIAVGEWLPLMPAVQRFQEAHPAINQALTGGTIAMTILGTLLLAFTQFLVRVPDPRVQNIKSDASVKGPGWFFSEK